MTRRARWYQQCWSDRDSKVGSFLFDPRTGQQYSPTFADSVEFLTWTRANGWRQEQPGVLTSEYVQEVQP